MPTLTATPAEPRRAPRSASLPTWSSHTKPAPTGLARTSPVVLLRTLARTCRRTARAALLVRAASREAAQLGTGSPWAPRARSFALTRLCGEVCATTGLRVRASGPVPRGPVVLVCHGAGWIAPLAIATLVPCLPILPPDLSRWPLLGALVRRHGLMVAPRNGGSREVLAGARILRAAASALDAGASVLSLPAESNAGTAMGPMRGIFGIARRLGAPVVPVAVRSDVDEQAPEGEDMLRSCLTSERPVEVQVLFGCAMTPQRYGSASDLAEEAHAMIAHLRSS